MKLLIQCNMVPGCVRVAMGQNDSGAGLWLDYVLSDLMKVPEMNLIVLCRGNKKVSGKVSDNFAYSIFEEAKPQQYYPELQAQFAEILASFCPDVIHIWGTEYGHTLAMVNAAEQLQILNRIVINIQGLCAFVEQHHNEGIPFHVVHGLTFRDALRRDNLYQMGKTYTIRGVLEVQALRKVKNVIGRTEWDRAACMQVNPNLNYFHCNETMRPNFYAGTWKYSECTKHRVFAPGWRDPSKGFHHLLRAFAEVVKMYPDATITVPGASYFPKTLKQKLRMRAYDKYLAKVTKRLGLCDRIHFLGSLSAEEMKAAFLDANVFVMPSNIENSPNTVCESMLLGVPCVSSLVGGMLKMMIHGTEGFIYQTSAEYMLAYYVKEVFRMGESAQPMGQMARKHALQTHDPDANLKTLLSVYRTIESENK